MRVRGCVLSKHTLVTHQFSLFISCLETMSNRRTRSRSRAGAQDVASDSDGAGVTAADGRRRDDGDGDSAERNQAEEIATLRAEMAKMAADHAAALAAADGGGGGGVGEVAIGRVTHSPSTPTRGGYSWSSCRSSCGNCGTRGCLGGGFTWSSTEPA